MMKKKVIMTRVSRKLPQQHSTFIHHHQVALYFMHLLFEQNLTTVNSQTIF